MLFPREWRKASFAKANSNRIRRSFTIATASPSLICELAEKWIIARNSANKIGSQVRQTPRMRQIRDQTEANRISRRGDYWNGCSRVPYRDGRDGTEAHD